MPRSRSSSLESRTWARIALGSSVPVTSNSRSARVDLPWSMCATIQKFRMFEMRKPSPGVGLKEGKS